MRGWMPTGELEEKGLQRKVGVLAKFWVVQNVFVSHLVNYTLRHEKYFLIHGNHNNIPALINIRCVCIRAFYLFVSMWEKFCLVCTDILQHFIYLCVGLL